MLTGIRRIVGGNGPWRFAAYGLAAAVALLFLQLSAASWQTAIAVVLLPGVLALAGFDLYNSVVRRLARIARDQRSDSNQVRAHRDQLSRVQQELNAVNAAVRETSITAQQARAAAEQRLTDSQARRGSGTRTRVLFITSNGSGMGHLTRLAAIAEAGDFDSSFLSLSSAAGVLAKQGYSVTQVESQSTSGLSWPEWNRRFSGVLRASLESERPDVVVFDGIWVFRGVHEQVHAAGLPLVWVCRGLWKRDSDRTQVQRWRDVADELILPSEGALIPEDEVGPVAPAEGTRVNPIVYSGAFTQRVRADALQDLDFPENRRYVLIQLGSGALGSRDHLEAAAVSAVLELGSDWQPVVLRSPLRNTPKSVPVGAISLECYPVAHALAAFEFSVTSAGYNTVHEHVAARHPAVYVPDLNMLTDDQMRRARAIAEAGAGLLVHEVHEIGHTVKSMASETLRDGIRSRMIDLACPSGAEDAAKEISMQARRQWGCLQITKFSSSPAGS